jgi:hypothetical protein
MMRLVLASVHLQVASEGIDHVDRPCCSALRREPHGVAPARLHAPLLFMSSAPARARERAVARLLSQLGGGILFELMYGLPCRASRHSQVRHCSMCAAARWCHVLRFRSSAPSHPPASPPCPSASWQCPVASRPSFR